MIKKVLDAVVFASKIFSATLVVSRRCGGRSKTGGRTETQRRRRGGAADPYSRPSTAYPAVATRGARGEEAEESGRCWRWHQKLRDRILIVAQGWKFFTQLGQDLVGGLKLMTALRAGGTGSC